jgi:phytoene dehydrogenase-like protein
MGSDRGSSFYKMWSELLDMESIPFHNHDLRIDIQLNKNKDKYNDNVFHFFTNLDKLENYLIDLSPEDSSVIEKFIKRIRLLQKYDLPPISEKLPFFKSLIKGMGMIKYFEVFPLLYKWSRETNFTFAKKFKSPFLQEAFNLIYDEEEVKMLVFTLPHAYFDKKSAGYPIGGSNSFTKKLEEKYLLLGGKINFNSDVNNVIIENNVAVGLKYNKDKICRSDFTLSTADWYYTFFKALDGKYVDENTKLLSEQKKLEVFFSAILFSYGVKKDYSDLPHFSRFPLKQKLISPDGTIYTRLELRISNFDKTIAPKGKSLLSVSLYTKNGDFWIDLRNENIEKYNFAKNEFSEQILDALEMQIGNIRDELEMTDIASPATILRYTNNWKGSTQGWLPGKNFLAASPVGFKVKGLNNFYYSSHWNTPGGGLPVVIKNSREVTQLICKKNKIEFKNKTVF